MLKVSTFIYRHLHFNDQQRCTIRSGVLTSNDTRWRSASSGSPLPEWTDPAVCSQTWEPTHSPASRTMAFTAQCSLATTLFLVASITTRH